MLYFASYLYLQLLLLIFGPVPHGTQAKHRTKIRLTSAYTYLSSGGNIADTPCGVNTFPHTFLDTRAPFPYTQAVAETWAARPMLSAAVLLTAWRVSRRFSFHRGATH